MEKLTNIGIISIQDYVDDFLKTLSNFCSKCPLQTSINYVKELNKVFIKYNEETITIDIDINENKKTVIKNIKNILQKDYPIIYNIKDVIPSADEIESLIASGIPLSEALDKTKTTHDPLYRVMRIHHKYNEIDLFNIKTKEMFKYKSKIPVIAILNKLDCGVHVGIDEISSSISLMYKIEKKEGDFKK